MAGSGTEREARPAGTPIKDRQTVTPEGVPTAPRIDGVVVRPAVTHPDERGELCEIYNPAWGVSPEPLVYVYQSMVRPGKVKGWIVHDLQDDRIFVSLGTLRWVLYDAREGSPTRGLVNQIVLSESNRALLVIPRGVYHAAHNVGDRNAYFVNCPTRPYDHADPDKHRLPLANDLIPFRFEDGLGG
jgi:dTDP-4-dehydrorhamnose 3,5-epimerase